MYIVLEINVLLPVDFHVIDLYCGIQSMLYSIKMFYYNSIRISEVIRRLCKYKCNRGELKLPVHECHHGLKEGSFP
jgi:hypothetical protein